MNNYSLGSTRLMRSHTDRRFAGVCGGLAEYFAIDSVIVRLIFVALLFAGIGFLLYPVMWLVMPKASSSNYQANVALPQQNQQPLNAVQQQVGATVGKTLNANARFDPLTGMPLSVEPARFDPYTGAPVGNETVLPINNVAVNASSASSATMPNPQAVQRRQTMMKVLGLGIAVFIAGSFLTHAGSWIVPMLLVGAGIYLLRSTR
ncbi:MAG: PspC domain-containing protein [Herpetosiphon sp.]|nr:PspC domain-containing protein [Herpetosiphon sp.]